MANARPSGSTLRLEAVVKTYGTGGVAVHALRGVDLEVAAGEFVVVLGPSGSGKTTLLNVVGGIESPTSGRVVAESVDLTSLDAEGQTAYRRDHVGFVFQFFNLIPTLTARENVGLIAELTGGHDDERVTGVLREVGLGDRLDHFPGGLSGGEQQRVASGKMMLRSRGVIFALPGIAVFLVMFQLQDITVAVASTYKARGILRRLAVTPVSPRLVIATQILSYVLLGIGAAALVLTVGKLLGGHLAMTANLLWPVPLIGMAVLTALATAFTVAGLTPNPQTASNVGVTISFLLFAFTGAILPVRALPGSLPDIVPYGVPQAALIEAIRGIALTGAGITRYGTQVLIGFGWLAVTLVAAAIAYRFTED